MLFGYLVTTVAGGEGERTGRVGAGVNGAESLFTFLIGGRLVCTGGIRDCNVFERWYGFFCVLRLRVTGIEGSLRVESMDCVSID